MDTFFITKKYNMDFHADQLQALNSMSSPTHTSFNFHSFLILFIITAVNISADDPLDVPAGASVSASGVPGRC